MNQPHKLAARLRKNFIAEIALILLGLSACPPSRTRDVDVVFAADQLGFIAPCGCSQHQLGGAARASAFLLSIAAAGPTAFIEGGNLLFGESPIPAEKRDQDRDKAVALVKSWQVGAEGLPALWATGPFDAVLGDAFRSQAFVGKPLLTDPTLLEIGGVVIGVIPLKGPQDKSAAQTLREKGAPIVIAIVDGPWKSAADWAESAGADVALQSGVADPVQDTDEGAQTGSGVPVFRVKDKGRGLLVLHLHLPKRINGVLFSESQEARKARADELSVIIDSNRARLKTATGSLQALLQSKISELEVRRNALLVPATSPPLDKLSFSVRFVDLTDQLPSASPAEAIFRAYTAETGRKNLAAQAQKVCPMPKQSELHYVGVTTCKTCHAGAYAVYSEMKHAHATRTLIEKGRQYDLDCVGCHVLGYGQPGGVCRLDQVKMGVNADVQCESCHGMGSAHAQNPSKTAPPEARPGYETCVRCHDPDNDARFNRDTYVSYYLPLIVRPGHGMP